MKRKIIGLAKNTNVVTLPMNWCVTNNLEKGDEVEVFEHINSIVISPVQQIKKASVDVSGKNPLIKRILGSFYKGGFTHMSITYETQEEAELIEDVIDQEFVGFEIIHHDTTKKRIIAKTVSEIQANDFDVILRRMFLRIIQIGTETLECLESLDTDSENVSEKTFEKLQKIASLDKDVNKLADFCRRAINLHSLRQINENYQNNLSLYYIVEELEKISDEFRDFAISKYPYSAKEIFKEVVNYFRMFYELFYAFSLSGLVAFGKKRYDLRDKIDSIEPFSREFSYCRSIVEKTFDMNGALMLLYNRPDNN